MSKPFAMRELLARIAVQLRGPRGEEVPCLAFEDLMLDPATRQVTVGGVPVHLTRTEYAPVSYTHLMATFRHRAPSSRSNTRTPDSRV